MVHLTPAEPFIIKDEQGNVLLTIKLIGNKSRIFFGEEEFMTCRFVPLSLPAAKLPQYVHIESINDLIDGMDRMLEREEELSPNLVELDFFVNCSNVEAWVIHDFDTRVLDYKLSFPLLGELAKRGHSRAQVRYKEEILKRYSQGSEAVKEYLAEDGFMEDLTDEELLSMLPIEEQEAMRALKSVMPNKELPNINIEENHVEFLELSMLWIDGKSVCPFSYLPEEVLKLKHLKRLYITLSELTVLPVWLSGLPELMEVRVWHTPLEGVFAGLKSFPSLRTLDLYGCDPCVLSEEFGNLGGLNGLKIEACDLRRLPESFGRLSSLGGLLIAECPLEQLPESFGGLTGLIRLFLKDNALEELPESFGALKNLTQLDLSNNNLSSLPASFSQLDELNYLNLSDNKFTEFPKEVIPLWSLEQLIFFNNKIEKLLDEIGNFKQLKRFEIVGNQIKEIPESIGNIATLETLNLIGNNIFTLPKSVGNLKNLKDLNLGYNKFKSLPESIGNIESLTSLSLYANDISILPENLRNLKNLRRINVGNTKITSLSKSILTLPEIGSIYVKDSKIPLEILKQYKEQYKKIKFEF